MQLVPVRYTETHSVQALFYKPLPMERRKDNQMQTRSSVQSGPAHFLYGVRTSEIHDIQVQVVLKTPPSSPGWGEACLTTYAVAPEGRPRKGDRCQGG